MLARIFSCAIIVEVEVDISPGLPGMDIVGLPDAAVQESRQRVQAATKNAVMVARMANQHAMECPCS